MEEIFKDIPGYNGDYQVSNLGRIKSLKKDQERILKQFFNTFGYLMVGLSNGKGRLFTVHSLMAMTFLNHKPNRKTVVDHINNDRTDNRLENLQIVTARYNSSKDRKGTSKYTGVSYYRNGKKWRAQIRINGKLKHIGFFSTELGAYLHYVDALDRLTLKQ
jgi:hypothetical protein